MILTEKQYLRLKQLDEINVDGITLYYKNTYNNELYFTSEYTNNKVDFNNLGYTISIIIHQTCNIFLITDILLFNCTNLRPLDKNLVIKIINDTININKYYRINNYLG